MPLTARQANLKAKTATEKKIINAAIEAAAAAEKFEVIVSKPIYPGTLAWLIEGGYKITYLTGTNKDKAKIEFRVV